MPIFKFVDIIMLITHINAQLQCISSLMTGFGFASVIIYLSIAEQIAKKFSLVKSEKSIIAKIERSVDLFSSNVGSIYDSNLVYVNLKLFIKFY